MSDFFATQRYPETAASSPGEPHSRPTSTEFRARKLWLCVYLPALSLEIFTRGAHYAQPLAIRTTQERLPVILICNAAAARGGVRAGLRVSAAQALVPELKVLARAEAHEQAALKQLAAWAGQFTSMVSLVPPAALVLEIGGSLRLFHGAERLQARVRAGVHALGYRVQLACAPTPLAAQWLAQAGGADKPDIGLVRRLAPLPLAVLGLDAKQQERLHGMGVRRLGDCLRLPRDGLARRFGPELVRLLDQAQGHAPDPRPAFVPPATFHANLPLPAEVVAGEALLFAAQRLLRELCGTLRARVLAVQTIELILQHHDHPATQLQLGLVAPSRDEVHLLKLLRERFTRLVLPAPVLEIELHARHLHAAPGTERDWVDGDTRTLQHGTALIEHLRARLGDKAVRGLCAVSEHRPEYAWRWCPPGRTQAEKSPAPSHSPVGKRPLWLLPQPLPLAEHRGHPYWHGELQLDPERECIESGWWDGGDAARDYFIARNPQGMRLWIYRERDGARRWFLHGVLD